MDEKTHIIVEAITNETDKAIEVFKDSQTFWLPKSQVRVRKLKGRGGKEVIEVEVPKWLARKKGIPMPTLFGEAV